MIELANSPAWFYGVDALIDLFSAGVLILVALVAARYYFLAREKNYLWFTFSYLIIAMSFICKAVVQYLLRVVYIANAAGGILNVASEELAERAALFYGVFFAHAFLLLLGFYILYALAKQQSKSNHVLFVLLLIVAAFYAGPYHVAFHTITAIFLAVLSIHFWQHYKEHRVLSTKLLALSFSALMLSEILFVFVRANSIIYVGAAVVQLAAFVALLSAFLFIKHGKKKIAPRNHA